MGLALGARKAKDFAQREQRKGGEKSEKDIYRRDAECAEKGNRSSGSRTVPD
jgi:general stress protein YciG